MEQKKKTRDGTKIHLHRIKAKNKKKDKTNEKKKRNFECNYFDLFSISKYM